MRLPGLQWTRDCDALAGVQITEVDMAAAGLTVIRQDGLLPEHVLTSLEAMSKGQAAVAVGKISRLPAHRDLADRVTRGIRQRVETLLEANGVGEDRLLSVKRDAVFVTGPPPSTLVLPDGTRFRLKGSYTVFARLGPVELYGVPRRAAADLKGIPPERRVLHQDYTVQLVLDVLGLAERGARVEAAATLQQFRRDYVERRLPAGFYRQFNAESAFVVRAGRQLYAFDGASELPVSEVDLAYNLHNVIVPLGRFLA